MKIIFTFLVAFLIEVSAFSQTTYEFDNSAKVFGCGKAVFQKISNDWQCELRLEVEIDSIPKFKKLEINEFPKKIKVFFRRYPKDNDYVDEECNDALPVNKRSKMPDIFRAIEGIINITYGMKRCIRSALF